MKHNDYNLSVEQFVKLQKKSRPTITELVLFEKQRKEDIE
jgi:hypothetical protein